MKNPTPSPEIREARPSDATLIRDFQLEMAIESENLRLDPEVCLRGVKRIFDEPSLGYYLVFERPGSGIVGCTLVQKEWSDWRARMVLWIHSLYVKPEFRGQGLYRAAYRLLQERVKNDAELGGLRLYVDQKNLGAIAVYEKLGMTRDHYSLYEWMK